MFESTLGAGPKHRFRHLFAVGSVAIHLVVGGVFLVLSFWEIHKLQRPSRGVAMASTLTLPPPGGGGPRAEPKRVERKEPAKSKIVREARQPSKTDKAEPESAEATSGDGEAGDGAGVGPGTGDGPGGPGTGLGIPLGDLCLDESDLCAPPPLPVAVPDEPENVPAAVLGSLRRVAGNPQIQPPSSTKNAMSRAGQDRATAILLVCLDTSGAVNKARLIRSSGYADYDAKLRSEVGRWRYEPYRANGIPASICTQLTFVYRQE